MPLPILVGIVVRAAAVVVVKQAGKALAKKAARQALQRKMKNAAQQAQKRLDAKTAARKERCPKCKALKHKCDLLRSGTPANKSPYAGGNYNGTKAAGKHSHHMPADSAYPATSKVTSGRRPAIQMDPADHRQTASYGSSPAAKAYRSAQRKMIRSGNTMGAFMMDVADIKSKFGDKYDAAIADAAAYAACLKKEGKIK